MKLIRNPWFWCLWAALIAIVLIWSAYRLNWPGTGFQGKTVWDWLSLFVIPMALALVALFFNQMNTRTERQIASQRYEQDQQIASDKQREDLLQAYLDRMSELLLEKGLRTSAVDAEVRKVARMRTVSVLRQLDARRVGDVFAFLSEAGLTDTSDPVISLKNANLSGVKWERARLIKADLRGAYLLNANLNWAILHKANLSGIYLHEAILRKVNLNFANLNGADLSRANLSSASLFGTDLSRANLSSSDLSKANLNGANLNFAILNGADLSGADLSGANLSNAGLSDTKLKNAEIDKSRLTPEQIAQAVWD